MAKKIMELHSVNVLQAKCLNQLFECLRTFMAKNIMELHSVNVLQAKV